MSYTWHIRIKVVCIGSTVRLKVLCRYMRRADEGRQASGAHCSGDLHTVLGQCSNLP